MELKDPVGMRTAVDSRWSQIVDSGDGDAPQPKYGMAVHTASFVCTNRSYLEP